MATNGMTIDGLNTVSSLTAQDEVPVWDKEASGEPTRKITAQNMANSVKSLASLPNTTEMNTAIAQSTAHKATIKSYTVSPNSDLSITNELPAAYALFTIAGNGSSLGAVIGAGYGATASRHKINKIIDPAAVTIEADGAVFGLNIHNGSANAVVTVYVINFAV